MLIEHLKALGFIVIFVLIFDSIRYWKPVRKFIDKYKQKQDEVIEVKPRNKLRPNDPRVQEYLRLDIS